ncbi:DUF4365 domain-containing protein [Altererythrobacter sp. RZ02]|uniref:DUF4365 domain-containing protein n=1 Tax=Pontixanthobacter rizhaonensis TaxID=2730337 RepID=A0A848QJD5_9SPHN|nr:DUF4365 domain-containing protein [Pontixanthobacter rizhaonensis]NMW32752.1 DUF4365 domain-containing protein [Pontixanthobacter rizhaonensis]
MDLPRSTKQQEAEATSFDILRYKLAKHIGIFRSQTESDYGIDFEIELKINGRVTGRLLKAQVKSSKKFKPRKDGLVAVGGIKQSTLAYWCEISQQTNVIAYAVDLESEIIYSASNLFWQATKLLDGGDASKSVEFVQHERLKDEMPVILTLLAFSQPTVPTLINSHRSALRNLKQYLALLDAAYQYDAGSPLHDPDHFAELLEVCEVLLWRQLDKLFPTKEERKYWADISYWDQRAMEDGWGELCYDAIKPVVAKLVPALIAELQKLERRVLAGKYYWANSNARYLKLVYETTLPEDLDIESLRDLTYEFDALQKSGLGDYFVQQARQPHRSSRHGKSAAK